jgi:hypothetical protein
MLSRIEGRPTVLWSLRDRERSRLECLGGTLADGRFHVSVVREGLEQVSKTFDGAPDAVRWAVELEGVFVGDGWSRQ